MIEISVMTVTPHFAVSTQELSAVSQASATQHVEVATFQEQLSVRIEIERVEVFG